MKYSYFYVTSILLMALVGLFGGPSFGQNISATDLSNVRVDDLSDDQIRSYLKQAEASGLTENQMEAIARERGMPPMEIQKLRERIANLDGTEADQRTSSASSEIRTERGVIDSLSPPTTTDTGTPADSNRNDDLRIFGASLFQGASPVFEPDLRIATPQNYVVGPGDQILIDIYGKSEEDHTLSVSPEGTINIPYIGVISVAGMTMEQATARIKSSLATVYSAIRTGDTKVSVALGDIRSIQITITGEVVRPGSYTLPSVANAFNALYFSGGPTENGSFRDIRVIRNGKEVAVLDIYDVLMNGFFSTNIRLEDQDVLMVPPYQNRVSIRGQVKRPAIFELKEGETFDELLAYAGGFTEDAYRARIKVTRQTDKERRIEDLLQTQFAHYTPQLGDRYEVAPILKRFENRVRIEGAVFRPGDYELSAGLTLSMLIKKADGLKEDAFLNRGYILRLQDDMQTEQLSFDVAGIVAGTTPDVELKREDVVTIASIFDLREQYTVDIDGEVRFPGQFSFAEGMTLQDLIVKAGGFRESATSSRIAVSRRVKNADAMSQSAQTAEVFHVATGSELSKADQDFVLMPFDQVVVRTATGYETQKTVWVEGEVLYPGEYTLTRKDERISDIIKRAGGFTPFAYVDGASLKRAGAPDTLRPAETGAERAKKERAQQEESKRMLTLRQLQNDESAIDELAINRNTNNEFVGINLERIIENPGYRGDLILQEGDVIRVPKELQTVKISGEVLAPSTAVYAPSKGFKQYISQAGGFSSRALKKSAYVLYANGSVKSTNRFLFFNNYPPIKPGAEIFVPQKEMKDPLTPQQLLGIGSGAASLVAIILTMLR
ncbi:SLBB domain-containing protein [Parapedobacter sp. 10938]|uniref:SLBB domain-containing protein n=1 Tax=Parapedobacter flavus TaxID=3110225 RepID=UPI002DBD10C8|nr:SLBB domain-containing protein [Parapedobacter sp. 10938]MEC3879549.1 SLBB domain-containing protein [Parapedobacter sp. 10938]